MTDIKKKSYIKPGITFFDKRTLDVTTNPTPIPFSYFLPNAQSSSLQRILLIVDDDDAVCASLSRFLAPSFNLVLTANTSKKAISILNALEVTHLVCDYWLGNGEPQGSDLIPAWRKKYRSIRKAVLFTGSDLGDFPPPFNVDKILSKSDHPLALLSALKD